MSSKTSKDIVRFMTPVERLEYTGERFTSGQGGPIEHEHRHRYLVAASICEGKEVLDIASGEGFGSAYLASVASHVTGVDVSPEAVAFARRNYAAANLAYKQGSATAIPLENASVDVVVSFESIEHFFEHDVFLEEVRRVLRPDGVLLISSPNKGIYPGEENHFHVKELTQDEFVATVRTQFFNLKLLEQKATTGSIIAPTGVEDAETNFRVFRRLDDFSYEASPSLRQPIYSLILASNVDLPSIDWGVLDDEGYVAFLQTWIQDADARRQKLADEAADQIANLKVELERSTHALSELKRGHAQALAQDRFELAKHLSNSISGSVVAERQELAAKLEAALTEIRAIKTSTSWKASAPIRLGKRAVGKMLRMTKYAKKRIRPVASAAPGASTTSQSNVPDHYSSLVASSSALTKTKRILIVAETSLPQCAKYRVWQKKSAIENLGFECTVVNWGEKEASMLLLQTHNAVIFYRVPGWPDILAIVREAHRLKIPTYWEVDDLIFDHDAYTQNRNLDLISASERESILFGVPLYREALLTAGGGIASTSTIADQMRRAGAKNVFVIQNAIDDESLRVSADLVNRPRNRKDDRVVVFYGSGSRAHNADFQEAAQALVRLLKTKEDVHLRIAGHLDLPDSFVEFGSRVERLPMTDFPAYLAYLREADISIAPLENSIFNDAKSNIKFLEAALVEVPSVCSPRKTFKEVILNGENGFTADSEEEWFDFLLKLASDRSLRQQLGTRARETVLAKYSPQSVASQELQPWLDTIRLNDRAPFNILTANVFFEPQSFGGATIVCEQLAKRLHAEGDTSVAIFTTLAGGAIDQDLLRYSVGGIDVFAAHPSTDVSRHKDFENYRMAEIFSEVLKATKPDVVHLHCVQGLSASIADACLLAGVPYVVTLHDAWWICERQFMVNSNDRYCGQKKIDLSICATCVPNIAFTRFRNEYLRRVLDNASLLLAPSEFFRQLYISNGFPENKVRVNRNGVAAPVQISRSSSSKIRFAFVGGIGPIKGLDQIRRAFEELSQTNYELVLVDNTLNLGFSSLDVSDWKVSGDIRVSKAYKQSELDEFFTDIDVLLFPSQWKESFGLTVREALIRHVWVIANDAGGAVEDIQPGINGDVLPFTDDHSALRDAIANLLDAPEKLTRFVNPFAGHIATYDDQAKELLHLLRSVAMGHGAEKLRADLRSSQSSGNALS